MSFSRNRTNFNLLDDVDDEDRLPGEDDKSVLFQTTGTNLRNARRLVGSQIVNQHLIQERRNKALEALLAVRKEGDKTKGLTLLNSLTSSPVTDIVPASAASQTVEKSEVLPPVAEEALAEADSPNAKNQVPVRGRKWYGKSRARPTTMADFKRFMPLQLEHPPHPEGDRSNAWFKDEYANLFIAIVQFATKFFGFQELQEGFHEPWAVKMPEEFYRYVELVAEPDTVVGGWDEILLDTNTRKYLIVGIIVKILEARVFSAVLWGNTKEGEEFLHGLDRALLDSEGYSRQELRRRSIRTLLGGASLTPNFHRDCTKLTAQVLLLFLPLFNYLTLLPAGPETVTPKATALYQSLHNIFSSAAYLSICIRISPTIIHTVSLMPGTAYTPDEHTSILQNSWTLSKTVVQNNWNRDREELEIERAKAEGYVIAYSNAGKARLESNAGLRALRRLQDVQKKLADQKPPGFTHEAGVKIAIWPVTKRYWAGNSKPGGDMDGQSVFNVTTAGAVFYYKEKGKLVEPLLDFVAEKEKKLGRELKRVKDLLTILGFLSLGTFLVLLYVVGWAALVAWLTSSIAAITDSLRESVIRGRETASSAYEYTGSSGYNRFGKRREQPIPDYPTAYSDAKEGIKEGFQKGASMAEDLAGDTYERLSAKAKESYDEYETRKSQAEEAIENAASKAKSAGRVYEKATEKVRDAAESSGAKIASKAKNAAGSAKVKLASRVKSAGAPAEKITAKAKSAAKITAERVTSRVRYAAAGGGAQGRASRVPVNRGAGARATAQVAKKRTKGEAYTREGMGN
ncbi:uncharacterized protein EAF01_002689 [Botrytis porri]|uniref:uncharacterized protein n=1 Tax=Botrytis porri TaxID=87229 RepID=UPI001901951D|nr:uncharacterized protein EAF01_002689 [Botrytis porri]KAF7911181.1 hypothetical protein EAF01_002689 [Botrytis porri]